jgi:hypothetical protein
MTRPSQAIGQITLWTEDAWHRCTSHNLGSTWSALRRAAIKASLAIETPAASLPSEVKHCNGQHVRRESARVPRARPVRSRKVVAIEAGLCTEDRKSLRGFPTSTSAELVITEVFS